MTASFIRRLAQRLSPRKESAGTVVGGAQKAPMAAGALMVDREDEVGLTLSGEDAFGRPYRYEIANDPSGLFQVIDNQIVAHAAGVKPDQSYPILLSVIDGDGYRTTLDLTLSGSELLSAPIDVTHGITPIESEVGPHVHGHDLAITDDPQS